MWIFGLLHSLSVVMAASGHIPSADALCRRFDGVWAVVPNRGVKACIPAPSHFVWEIGRRGHMEQIWRRSRGTWCAWIWAVDGDS